MGELIEPAPPTDLTQAPVCREEEACNPRGGSSAKIDQLLHLLRLTPATEKSLVFSQFTGFLDKVRLYPLWFGLRSTYLCFRLLRYWSNMGLSKMLPIPPFSLKSLLRRISYVRFDGQMSAKRRQETLERFSLPLEDDMISEISLETHILSKRSSRRSNQITSLGDTINID